MADNDTLKLSNINELAQSAASVVDGDYIYIYKAGSDAFSRIERSVFMQGVAGGLSPSDIINSLDSDRTDKALSAAQGKELAGMIRDIETSGVVTDGSPTPNSTNAVQSGGVYNALQRKQDTIDDLATIRSKANSALQEHQPIKTINNQTIVGEGNINISGSGSITIDENPSSGSGNAVSSGGVYSALAEKQNKLVSGTNIKTINNKSILAGGNITVPEVDVASHIDYEILPRFVFENMAMAASNLSNQTWKNQNIGKSFFMPSKGRIYSVYNSGTESSPVGSLAFMLPDNGMIYYDNATEKFYKWDGTKMLAISNESQGQVVGGGGNAKYIEQQDGYSEDFCDPTKQQFNVPDKTFYDFIYYSSTSAITDASWETTQGANKVFLNPAKWEWSQYKTYSGGKFYEIDAHVPYAIVYYRTSSGDGENENPWNALTSKTKPTGSYVYVSYRTRHITSNKYGQWSKPVLWNNLDNTIKDKIENNNLWTNSSKSVRDEFLNNNTAALANASATRQFLQSVIDNATPDEVVIFPENKTFVIDFDPMGYYDDYADTDMRVEYDPYTIGKMLVNRTTGEAATASSISASDTTYKTIGGDPQYYNKIKFVGLSITHKVNIDLNGSTIKFVPNWLVNFNVVNVSTYKLNGTTPVITTDPSGTTIKNGTIDGSLDQVMFFPIHARTYKHTGDNFVLQNFPLTDYEHGHTLHASKQVSFVNLNVGNVIGDGLCVSSEFSWGDSFNMDYSGWIDGTGNRVDKSTTNGEHNGYFFKSPRKISLDTNKNGKTFDIVVRPYYQNDSAFAKVDIGPYYVDEYVTVAYYDADSMSASHCLGVEKVQYGETLHIPSGATYYSFCMHIDPSQTVAPWLMICAIIWSYGTEIRDCDIHDCGRDGMTLSCLKTPVILNNRITRCVQAIIDVESTAYMDDGIHIDGVISEFDDEGFACKTGDHLMLERSKISGLYTDEPYMHISDCELGWLNVAPGGSTERTFNSNISKPRRVVRDSIIRGTVDAAHTVFENCIFLGSFDVYLKNNRFGEYQNTFNHCTFKVPYGGDTDGISPGIYNDCIFRCDGNLMLQMYQEESNKFSPYTFKNCTFDIGSIHTKNNSATAQNSGTLLDIDSCVFNIRGHATLFNQTLFGTSRIYNANFQGTFIKRLVNSKINFVPNNSSFSEFYFTPYTNAVIENNVFAPTADASNGITFIKVYLRQISKNKAYDMVIRRNLVNYTGSNSKFVFVQTVTSSDNIRVNIEDNIFVGSGSIADVVFTIGQASTVTSSNPDEHQDYVAASSSNVTARLLNNRAIGGSITEATGNKVIRQ